MTRYTRFFLVFALLYSFLGSAQSSAETLHALKKLSNPARVLYIAAHPDDENTKLISYLANGVGAETAYLSLTRGDGGQNLIGNDLSEKLGVLRTQELLQARAIDGGTQFFTRAVDFGYSKTPDETFQKWNKAEVLQDVVYIIRKFRPDVIITRFPPDARAGHGHHTASAVLAEAAFALAADDTYAPEQLKEGVSTWQPKRLYWNTSTWWGLPLDSLAEHSADYLSLDIGGYDANLGLSYNEIASLSRTQHKSQGFGVSIDRGTQKEYLKYVAGEKAMVDVFEGVPHNYEAFGAKKIDKALQKLMAAFEPAAPYKSIPAVLKLKVAAEAINDPFQQAVFQEKIEALLIAMSGLRAEGLTSQEQVSAGDSLTLRLEIIQRSPHTAVLKEISVQTASGAALWSRSLSDTLNNNLSRYEAAVLLPQSLSSQPYWLKKPYDALFDLPQAKDLGKPENDPVLTATFMVQVGETLLALEKPIRYKYSDRVEGEIEKPMVVLPPLLGTFAEDNLIFTTSKQQEVNLTLKNLNGKAHDVQLSSTGFSIAPATIRIEAGEATKNVLIRVTPLDSNVVSTLQITYDGGKVLMHLTQLDFPHIDKRIVLNTVTPKLVRMPLAKKGIMVGYIMGAGDKVPEAIRQMGYEVDILDEEKLRTYDLSNYRAIVAGIRAYNTESWLPALKPVLMEYMAKGGTYVVQYNTRSRDLLTTDIGPYPFQLSRDRVTEENAMPTFLLPNHGLLNKPNKITAQDFNNWVQERGLYFADEWDEAYSAPLAWHDTGEEDLKGSLLVATYGKGAFVFTGISFFRELPAGVPGAYRLFANILSYKPKAQP
jgi:LmbE family N-acetylglucosaminyl deacetylase